MTGLSTTVIISLGIAFVAGKSLVPKPATGITAFTNFPFYIQKMKRVSSREDYLSASVTNWLIVEKSGAVTSMTGGTSSTVVAGLPFILSPSSTNAAT